jgi:hypothetical protein
MEMEIKLFFYSCNFLVMLSFQPLYIPLHTLVSELLAKSQYLEGAATGHLGTGFSWFSHVYKRMLRWFPTVQVGTACFSHSPPDLNFLDPYFIYIYMLSLFHIYVHA